MKKIIMIIFITVLISSCSKIDNTVLTDGSTSMERLIGFLSEAYMEKNPEIKITFNPTGSTAGINAVSENRSDIALSSRKLKENEKNLEEFVVAIDAIAMIVNRENPIEDLTVSQIGNLYKGKISNWNMLGGKNSPVVLIGREAASGTREGFEEITDTKNLCKYNQELTSTGDIVQTVANNPNAIGYVSLSSVKDGVKILRIEGVKPTEESVQNGEYKILRNFLFVTNKNTKMTEATKEFFDFATSKEADELILRAGVIPVKR